MRLAITYKQGFSLIELILVMTLVAIMAFIVVPRFANLSVYRTRVYYDEVLNTIRYARKLAVGKNLRIQADIASSSITLRQRFEGSNCTTGTTFSALVNPENNTSPYVRNAPNGVTLSPTISFYFDGLGRAYLVSGTSTHCGLITSTTITVNNSAFTGQITITGETGFVQGSI